MDEEDDFPDRPASSDQTNRAARFIPAPMARSLLLQEVDGHRFAANNLSSTQGIGFTADHIQEDAFQLSVQLQDYQGQLWHEGRRLPSLVQAAGSIAIYDYRETWRAEIPMRFECVNFHLPRPALETLVQDRGGRRLEDLRLGPGETRADPVIAALTASLLPALANPGQSNSLFRDHVGWSVAAHVVAHYGTLSEAAIGAGTLAAWQERRVKEMIDANLAGEISLTDIAAECGISVSHLTRAFRRSTGLPPHQWLLVRRVEQAKSLLLDPRASLAETAVACGFADQSHLTRVFSRIVGSPPGAWRRLNVA